jgi:hypothetical protein
MKKLLASLLLIPAIAFGQASQGINNGYLQGDLNTNGFFIGHVQAVGNLNAVIAATTDTVRLTTTLTAPRVLTLPAASAFKVNRIIRILDPIGAVSSTNTISVARTGSDTINGGTSNVVALANPYLSALETSDGSSKWASTQIGAGGGGTATNLAGGSGGTIPYQSAAGTTAMLANGTAGQVLQSNGTTTAPSWATLAGGGNALTSNPLSQFASTTSAQLLGVISDETGTGSLVFANGPALIAPILGTPASGVATNLTGTAASLTAGHVTTNANLTGDVTSSGNAATIAANVVTNAKAAQLAAHTIKSNPSGSTANATDSLLSAIIDDAVGSTRGSILERGASSWNIVTPGTSGYIWTSNGSGADPTYQAASGGSSSGTFIGTQILTSGTTYTPTSGTNSVRIRMVGGGGGGAGVPNASSGQTCLGSSGGAGSYLEVRFTGVTGTYTYAIGGAGTFGAAGGANDGGDGGATTFVNGGTTYTAPGGIHGASYGMGAFARYTPGGLGGAISTNGDVNVPGRPAEMVAAVSGSVAMSSNGASSQFGAGGIGVRLNSAGAATGNAATGFGSGGSGGISSGVAGSSAGGAGTPGVIIVEEYR